MKKNSYTSANTLPPVQLKDFMTKIQLKNANNEEQLENYYHQVSGFINNIRDFALGPFFWYVLDFSQLRTRWMSDDIGQMTAYPSEKYTDSQLDFFLELYHPEDQPYILSALLSAVNLSTDMELYEKEKTRFNIYGRMIDSQGEYRWTLMQLSKPLLNKCNEIESALALVYDLAYLRGCSLPLLSVIDCTGKETFYYKRYKNEDNSESEEQFVTKREKEILYLIAKGYNTPQISEKLYISYHTVEKHKCNLRKKTNTKTLSELTVYALKNNLLIL